MPLFATLLSIPIGARYSAVNLSPQQQKDKTLEAIADHITGIAQQQPVVFVLEDAHWADPTTQELIELLINRIQVIRLLVVVSFRPEFAPPWEDSAHVASLALDRLDPSECVAIVNHVVGGSALPGEAVDQIIAKTDGIPLFVEELTKTVLEASRLRGEVEEPGGTDQVTVLTIPTTLHDSLTARLDRLGWVKEVAQVAATIGREFGYDLLVAVSPLGEDELRSAVNRLADAEFVFPQGGPPQVSYTFKHALVRDAAYESQLLSKRAQLHTRIANVLEENFAEEAETQPELLAYHFTEGGHLGKATHYWNRAGKRAAEHAAHREAIGHFSSGLDMCQKYTPEAEHSRQEVGLLVGLAGSMRILDRYEEALEVLARAETLSIDGGYTTDLAEIHYLRGNVYFPMGNIDGCLQEHELSRQYAQQVGSSEGEARALSGLGDAYYMRGQMITAHEYFTRCIELCRKHELRHIEAANLQMLGLTRFYQNELKRALEDTLAAAQIAKELEQHRGEMVARLISSEILANMAYLDQAKFQLEEGQVLVRRLGAWRFEALYLCCMAKILRAEGHASEALGLLERATAISRKTGVEFSGPAVLGALALTTDDADIRQSALSEGEELLQAGSVGHNHFRFYRDAIEATLRAGDWDNADRFAAALTDFTRPEPLPWTNFYVSRGHSLAAYGRGQRDQGTLSEIARLAQEARGVDLRLALVALERAIETT
jgi:predicted ATPase